MGNEYTEWRDRWPRVIVTCDTAAAMGFLSRYYANRDDGSPCYTGARFEALAGLNENPNTLGPAELVAVSTLSVRIPGAAAVRLLTDPTAAKIAMHLHEIASDIDIIDAGPEILASDAPAAQLWKILRSGRDGIGRTRTSKLMAAKRPRLIPIWDSFVGQATGLTVDEYWTRFQTVLLADNRRIWLWLEALKRDSPTVPDSVSTLRILDVLLWKSVDEERILPHR